MIKESAESGKTPLKRWRRETSAGGVVYFFKEGVLYILLLQTQYPDQVKREWVLPKGHLEAGENAEQAALREVTEETGLTRLTLGQKISEESYVFYAKHDSRMIRKRVSYFLLKADPAEEVRPQKEEFFFCAKWFGAREAVQKVTYSKGVVEAAINALCPPAGDQGPAPV